MSNRAGQQAADERRRRQQQGGQVIHIAPGGPTTHRQAPVQGSAVPTNRYPGQQHPGHRPTASQPQGPAGVLNLTQHGPVFVPDPRSRQPSSHNHPASHAYPGHPGHPGQASGQHSHPANAHGQGIGHHPAFPRAAQPQAPAPPAPAPPTQQSASSSSGGRPQLPRLTIKNSPRDMIARMRKSGQGDSKDQKKSSS